MYAYIDLHYVTGFTALFYSNQHAILLTAKERLFTLNGKHPEPPFIFNANVIQTITIIVLLPCTSQL